ncbi:MAG: GNAT family N-acetyltransferase [Erysipelotrichales bacterium]
MRYEYLENKNRAKIIKIWHRSIKTTYDFIIDEDWISVEREFHRSLNIIDIVELYNGEDLIGFAGINNHMLEMLFLDPDYIGKGLGHASLDMLLSNFNIIFIDVNEQNNKAKEFYLRNGFEIINRSELDRINLEYPVLHLKRII